MKHSPAATILLGAWLIMAPPEALNWHCERVQHPEASAEHWKPTAYHFDTQESCESLRSELVHRESNPQRRKALIAYVQQQEGRSRIFSPLFAALGLCRKHTWQPLDYFGHTRCAYIEQ
jgi:hypothetical protein